MSRCLKCNYELTFLEKRHKYKCAKCSSLFTEEEIKLVEFKKYNRSERTMGKVEVENEVQALIKKNYKKLTEKEKKERSKELLRIYREEHREEIREYGEKYWTKHSKRILAKRKEDIYKSRENESRKARRGNNIEMIRLNGRI